MKDNLDSSLRQYFGYFNKKHEKVVYVSCFPKQDLEFLQRGVKKGGIPSWYNELMTVNDGGASYWRLCLNLKTKKIFGFNTNGLA